MRWQERGTGMKRNRVRRGEEEEAYQLLSSAFVVNPVKAEPLPGQLRLQQMWMKFPPPSAGQKRPHRVFATNYLMQRRPAFLLLRIPSSSSSVLLLQCSALYLATHSSWMFCFFFLLSRSRLFQVLVAHVHMNVLFKCLVFPLGVWRLNIFKIHSSPIFSLMFAA